MLVVWIVLIILIISGALLEYAERYNARAAKAEAEKLAERFRESGTEAD